MIRVQFTLPSQLPYANIKLVVEEETATAVSIRLTDAMFILDGIGEFFVAGVQAFAGVEEKAREAAVAAVQGALGATVVEEVENAPAAPSVPSPEDNVEPVWERLPDPTPGAAWGQAPDVAVADTSVEDFTF